MTKKSKSGGGGSSSNYQRQFGGGSGQTHSRIRTDFGNNNEHNHNANASTDVEDAAQRRRALRERHTRVEASLGVQRIAPGTQVRAWLYNVVATTVCNLGEG